MNNIFQTKKVNTYSDSSINILQDTLTKVRDIYEQYYHFDRVFVCVDEHTMQVIDYETIFDCGQALALYDGEEL